MVIWRACCRAWLQAHIDDVKYLGKPLVLEEFGKAVGELVKPCPLHVLDKTHTSLKLLADTPSGIPLALDSSTATWSVAGILSTQNSLKLCDYCTTDAMPTKQPWNFSCLRCYVS